MKRQVYIEALCFDGMEKEILVEKALVCTIIASAAAVIKEKEREKRKRRRIWVREFL